jgi:hypothetical protein
LWNQPTAINNVETFAFATVILVRGVEWFKSQGKNGSPGMKFVGISGDVNRPGVFEVPMGTKYSELIQEYAGGVLDGRALLGFAPSGPSSGYLPRVHGRPSAGLECLGGGRLDGGFRSNCGLWRRPLHAGYGTQRGALLSQRILREVSCPAVSVRRRWSRCSRDGRKAALRIPTCNCSTNSPSR